MKYIHEFVNLKNAYYLCLNWGKINGFGNQRCKVWQYILKEIELKVDCSNFWMSIKGLGSCRRIVEREETKRQASEKILCFLYTD